MVEDELFERGLQVRREVLGAEYVDASLEAAAPFTMAFQRLLTVGVGPRLEPTGSRPEDTVPAEARDPDGAGPARRAGRLRAGSACDWMHGARDSRSLAPRDRLLWDAGWTTGIPRGGCSVKGSGRGRVANRPEAPRPSGNIPEHEAPGTFTHPGAPLGAVPGRVHGVPPPSRPKSRTCSPHLD